MGGGGNWEFEMYVNNRSNSFVKNGALYIQPTLTADNMGADAMVRGGQVDMWGGTPSRLTAFVKLALC